MIKPFYSLTAEIDTHSRGSGVQALLETLSRVESSRCARAAPGFPRRHLVLLDFA